MKCPHCGCEWSISSQITQKMEHCPFCGGSLCQEPEKPETLEDSLRMVYKQFGVEPFQNGKALLSLLSDLVPQRLRDRRLLGHLLNAGGHSYLLETLKKPEKEQSVAICRLAKQMETDWMIQPAAVREVCTAFWLAIGGHKDALKGISQEPAPAPKSTPAPKSAPAKKPAPTKKPASAPIQNSTSVTLPSGAVCRPEDYEIKGDVLIKYNGKDPVIQLPRGIRVIGKNAIAFISGIREIVLPEGVQEIDTSAFAYCRDLKRIHFPASLEKIGICAFQNCAKMTSLQLPDGIQVIHGGAFLHCEALTEVIIPGALETVPHRGFGDCKNLQRVVLMSGVKSLDNNSFQNCSALRAIVIPDTVQSIHAEAFVGCRGIAVDASQSWKSKYPEMRKRIP